MKKKANIRLLTTLLTLFLLLSLGLTGCSKKEAPAEPEAEAEVEEPEPEAEPEPEETAEWTPAMNYLTGVKNADAEEAPEGYLPLRPMAIVVENSYDARPQWGMDDPEYSPDIILEGEVEGGISRTLWFYADYNKMPGQIGPIRSARPPFIMFSQLLDSVFIHWGLSHSLDGYVGADTVFERDNVDHIGDSVNGMYGRDTSRNTAIEHRGVLYPSALPGALDQMGFRKEIQEERFSILPFNSDTVQPEGDDCTDLSVYFSGSSGSSHWTYYPDSNTYKSDSYKNNVERDNLIILMDNTEYIYVPSYKSGSGVTYCNYLFAGGDGKYVNGGKIQDFKWEVKEGKLAFYDKEGQPFKFNPGKSWIGWISANNGGNIA